MKKMSKITLALIKACYLLPVAIVFVQMAGTGWGVLYPREMMAKLSKLPGLSILSRYAWSHDVTVGMFTALVMFVFLSGLWGAWIKCLVIHDLAQSQMQTRIDVARNRAFLYWLGPLSLLAEAGVFFLGVQSAAWGESAGLSAFLATLSYVLIAFGANYLFIMWVYDSE